LHDLSQILRVKELDAPVITQAKTHFVVQNRQTKFIGLQVDSPIFQITGDGTIDFNGNLNANLVLVLTRDAMAKLPKAAADSFVQQQDGSGSIAFQVTGTTSDPRTDLAARLLMQNTQIKNVINKALNKFFH
ncbi:MAG: AsmA-like C-terminal region-containing protein, partial [Polyangia bacterium]